MTSHPKHAMHLSDVAPNLLQYLTADGSLTALLERQSRKPLCVQVISQIIRPLTFDEKKLLNLPVHRPSLGKVRKVLLSASGDIPKVNATSIFPLTSLTGSAKRLKHLKTTPVGYVLFKKNQTLPFTRSYFYDHHNQSWGRNTVYDWQGRKILIQEVFIQPCS
ncbi:chorismate lyase [Moraxella nasovis]|uniref:chorismate--pyruvate lyase family protein n=1 Tax=Moraxella nasovis TaxID=2904121 RepID=UPI001F603C17|nr:chorismate lyase [Moraxella nasovis]UNU73539.1 chorismate lyase [Moraxella nasovis]